MPLNLFKDPDGSHVIDLGPSRVGQIKSIDVLRFEDEDIVHAQRNLRITCVRQFGPYPAQALDY